MSKLWTPERVLPTTPKKEGGSYFDDEMELSSTQMSREQRNSLEMRQQLQQRPDHFVFVSSTDARQEMRKVLNFWFEKGEIRHRPTIRIDYGMADGQVRIGEH